MTHRKRASSCTTTESTATTSDRRSYLEVTEGELWRIPLSSRQAALDRNDVAPQTMALPFAVVECTNLIDVMRLAIHNTSCIDAYRIVMNRTSTGREGTSE